MPPMIDRICQHCASPFQAPRKNLSTRPVLFCGTTCMGAAKADPVLHRKCGHCGKTFQVKEWSTKRRPAEFCSMACNNKARSRPIAERFWEKVEKTDSCWLWQGALDGKGYGRIGIGNKHYTASRISYEMANGPITDGLHVCHKCDTPACVNPDHLFLGTAFDNNMDKTLKGRAAKVLKPEDIPEIRKMLARGDRKKDIADHFGVTGSMIRSIELRRWWKHK